MSYLITNQNNFSHIGYPCPSYPKATVKSGGCGACAVLNCVENTTELRFKMVDWIAYVISNGGRIDGGTSITAILKALKRDYGFGYVATNDLTVVKNHLTQGGFAVFHGGYGNVFSSAGHFVCLAGIDGDKAIVIDSGWYKGKYSTAFRKARVTETAENGVVKANFAYVEADKKYKNNQGTNYYLVTAPQTAEKNEDEMIYKTLDKVPNWAKPAVQLRIDLDAIKDPNSMTVYDSNLVDWTTVDRENPYYWDLADVPDYWQEDVRQLITLSKIKGDGKHQIAMRHGTLKAIIVAYR